MKIDYYSQLLYPQTQTQYQPQVGTFLQNSNYGIEPNISNSMNNLNINITNPNPQKKFVLQDNPNLTVGSFLANKTIHDSYINNLQEGKFSSFSQNSKQISQGGTNNITNVNINNYNYIYNTNTLPNKVNNKNPNIAGYILKAAAIDKQIKDRCFFKVFCDL